MTGPMAQGLHIVPLSERGEVQQRSAPDIDETPYVPRDATFSESEMGAIRRASGGLSIGAPPPSNEMPVDCHP